MRWFERPSHTLAQAVALTLVAGGVVVGPSVYAATAAGTQIKNQATVTYEDAAGNSYAAQSNEAIVTVAPVYSATLGVDIDSNAAPGQSVYLPYVLTNTGNATDTYALSALDGITGGDSLDASNIAIYNDTNGNGVPDTGEPLISSVTLDADEVANVIVAVDVPTTAVDGDTVGVTLTAQAFDGGSAAVAGSVTDLSPSGGRDGQDDTNESLITVTGDAVLVVSKSSVLDAANNQITYTINVKNNGNSAAQDVVIFDGLPANTSYVAGSATVSGLLATNGDTLIVDGALRESALGLDLNADGDQVDDLEDTLGIDLDRDGALSASVLNGIYAVDAELPAQATVSMSFTVSFDPATLGGSYVMENQAHATGDTDGDGSADTRVPSNIVTDSIGGTYGVTIADTGVGASPASNDGGDDDATINDDQYVDEAAAGGVVVFTNIITNNGTADDIYELNVAPGNFPAGTAFTFYDDSGVVQLGDTNGSGVDTGPMAPGEAKTIIVKATLPATSAGDPAAPATAYTATVTATSANDPSASPVSDSVTESLGTIVTAVADIHNSANGALGSDEDALGAAPYAAVNTFTANTGASINIPLYIDNESGQSDSFSLAAGSIYDGTTLGALPAGWSVEFFLGDGLGNPTGAALSVTPAIPGGTVDFEIIATVTLPTSGTSATNDFSADNDGDSVADVLDGNGDGDGDYPIFFSIVSPNTGATDIKLDAIDVNSERSIALTPPGSNQVEAGGTVNYTHTLSNSGNVAEVLEVDATNSQAGWTNTLSIDTNGDGVVDTELGNLVAGTSITVQQADGSVVSVDVTDADGDGIPELTVEPDAALPISATVFAPSNAAPASVDVLTITAANLDADPLAPSATVLDQTTVVSSQVRLRKTVAVDIDCNGKPETAFAGVQSTQVEPGQCAIWQVIAENQGDSDALNVIITDAVPAYSTYLAGSLQYCLTNGCTPAAVTDATADDAGEVNGTSINFYVGTGADPATSAGGTLVPGEKATAQFSVQVQ